MDENLLKVQEELRTSVQQLSTDLRAVRGFTSREKEREGRSESGIHYHQDFVKYSKMNDVSIGCNKKIEEESVKKIINVNAAEMAFTNSYEVMVVKKNGAILDTLEDRRKKNVVRKDFLLENSFGNLAKEKDVCGNIGI